LGIIKSKVSGTHFMPTTSFFPLYSIDRCECSVIDAHHGYVFFYDSDLIMFNPITGEEWRLPKPKLPQMPLMWTATLLCAALGCAHLDCPFSGPFTIIFVGTNRSMNFTSATIYSSETGM
jgi:hypothetical protein